MPGEINLFDLLESNGIEINEDKNDDNKFLSDYLNVSDFTNIEKATAEKEYTGLYLSGHPLNIYKKFISENVNFKSTDLLKDDEDNYNIDDGVKVSIVGIIEDIKEFTTKRTGEKMAKVTLSDLYGSFEVLLFSKKYLEYSYLVEKYKVLYIEGKTAIDERNDRATIYLDKLYDIDEYINLKKQNSAPPSVRLAVHFSDKSTFVSNYKELYSIMGSNKGKDFIKVIVDKEKQMKILKDLPVEINSSLINILNVTFGASNVEVINNE
jgi:DNA polymerase-3 subunit alpha